MQWYDGKIPWYAIFYLWIQVNKKVGNINYDSDNFLKEFFNFQFIKNKNKR